MRFLDGLGAHPGDLEDIRDDPDLHINHAMARHHLLRTAARLGNPTLRSQRLHEIAVERPADRQAAARREAFAVAVTIADADQRMHQFDWLATQAGQRGHTARVRRRPRQHPPRALTDATRAHDT